MNRLLIQERNNMTTKAIEHLKNAVTNLQQCWDELYEIEKLYDIEIETDDLADLVLFESHQMTYEILETALNEILKNK